MKPQVLRTFLVSSPRAKIVIALLVSPFVLFGISSALALDSHPGTRIGSVDSSSGIAGKSWADLGAEQFAKLPYGTQIVDCTPTEKRMLPGIMIAGGTGLQLNPGFHFLIDGRCAYDPSAIPNPLREDMVDGTPFTGMEWTPIAEVELSSLPSGRQIVNCWGDITQLPSGVRLQVGKNFPKEYPNFHFLTDGRCALSPNAISTSAEAVPNTYDLQWFGTGLVGTPSVGSSSCFIGDPLNDHCGVKTNLSTRWVPAQGPVPPNPSGR